MYSGGTWWKITGDPSGTDAGEKWWISYTLPGGVSVFYEALTDQLFGLFGAEGHPQSFGQMTQADFDAGARERRMYFMGNVAEVESPTGESMQSAYERAIASGLGTGIVPEELRGDTEIQSLVFVAQQEGWSQDRLYEAIAQTGTFMTRFPEIGVFRKQGMSVAQSVAAYQEYENLVNQLNMQYEGRPATRDEINALLRGQKSAQAITQAYAVFERFEENQAALTAFNEILVARGMQPLNENSMFAFLAGEAEDELYEIYAESSILEAGYAAGLGKYLSVGDTQAIVSFLGVDVPFERAYEGMTQAARLILQFRQDINLGELDPDDLIDLSLGVAPRSGRSQAQIAQLMERSLLAAQGFLRERARPATAIDAEGRLVRPGLRKLQTESID